MGSSRTQIVGTGNAILEALIAVGVGVAIVAWHRLLGDFLSDLLD